MFLDETEDVTNKARKTSLPPRTPASSATPPVRSPNLKQSLSVGDTPRSLSPNVEAQAAAFFFEQFAVDQSLSIHYQLSLTSTSKTSPGAQALGHSIQALGLMGLSRSQNAPQLSQQSESQCLEAVRDINAALQDSKTATQDSTLLAVLILASYETMSTNDERATLTAWSNHVKGAAALLVARGPEQLKSPDGLRLFIQASTAVVASCIYHQEPIDSALKELYAEAKQHADLIGPAWQLFEHKLLFADFFGRYHQKIITDPILIIQEATELDSKIASIGITLQQTGGYAFEITQIPEPIALIPLGYYHTYTSFNSAETWNDLRNQRIQLNQIIRTSILEGDFNSHPHYMTVLQQSTDSIQTLQDEIVASVPQYLGHGRDRRSISSTLESTTPSTKGLFLWSHFPQKSHFPHPRSPTRTTSSKDSSTPFTPLLYPSPALPIFPQSLSLLASTDLTGPSTDLSSRTRRNWCRDRLQSLREDYSVVFAVGDFEEDGEGGVGG